MIKEIIYIDLDGVTWEIHEPLVELYNKKYGTNYKRGDINKWGFFPFDKFNIILSMVCKKIDEYRYIDEMITYYINTLNKFYDVYFLTHGIYTKKDIKKKLKSWGIIKGKSYIDIIIQKPYVNKKIDLNGRFWIDDNPHMVEDIIKYPEKELLLFDSPWNRYININGFNNVHRVNNWEDAFRFFENKQGKILY